MYEGQSIIRSDHKHESGPDKAVSLMFGLQRADYILLQAFCILHELSISAAVRLFLADRRKRHYISKEYLEDRISFLSQTIGVSLSPKQAKNVRRSALSAEISTSRYIAAIVCRELDRVDIYEPEAVVQRAYASAS